MAFIPENARWFIGEFVESIRIEGQRDVLVHINTLLIEARSAQEAFDKAQELGAEMNSEYENTEGETVICRFEGLQELNVIHDELEHGAELCYQALSGVGERRLRGLITAKESLAVFRERKSAAENYFPLSVAQELKKRLEDQQ